MRVLHHYQLSASSRFTRLLLAERGLIVLPKIETPWLRNEDFLTLNPAGDLPVLVGEDGMALCGATVIAEYIEETEDSSIQNLLWGEAEARAEIRRLVNWFENKLNHTIDDINKSFSKYKISEALMSTYKLIWDDFCSIYLEIIKPEYTKPIDKKTYNQTISLLENILQLLHPFMPFLSEEIWHLIDDRESDIIVSQWPKEKSIDEQLINDFNNTVEVVSGIRNIRKEKNIAKKEKLDLFIINNTEAKNNLDSIIIKLGNLSKVEYTKKKIEQAFSFMVKSNEYFVPLTESFDKDAELEKLNKDLDYTKGFLKIVESKLSNKKFVDNAPTNLVENEKNKLKDAEEKIRILTEKINSLS